MRVWIAQIDTKVGDIVYNEQKIKESIQEIGKSSDVIVFPELTTTGYPPLDYLRDPYFLREQKQVVYRTKELINSINKDLRVVLWFVDFREWEINSWWDILKYNSAALVGEDIQIYNKQLLPNYQEFNETRYFAPWKERLNFYIGSWLASLLICEDFFEHLYDEKPTSKLLNSSNVPDYVFGINASPFSLGKAKERQELLKNKRRKTGFWIVYVNQVWAQDGLVFDGETIVINKEWEIIHLGSRFEEEVEVVDTMHSKSKGFNSQALNEEQNKYKNILDAQKVAIQDYLTKSWIENVVIGLSGGIDSALNLYILSCALDKQNIKAYYMPSRHNKSLEYAKEVCEKLGVELEVVPIDSVLEHFDDLFVGEMDEELQWTSYENLQARIRWMILITQANQYNWIVLNNANQTELALWYYTLYWDSAGMYNLTWDMTKNEIYEMAKYINNIEGKDIIPESIIGRPP